MSQTRRGETERARYWQSLVHEQEQSGLTQAAFCRQRQINPGTFAWWRRRLRSGAGAEPSRSVRSGRGTSRTDPVRFMEVEVVGSASKRYEIVLPGGRVLCVPGDFDPAHVARLIEAVESTC